MKRSSWTVMGICVLLSILLVVGYQASRSAPETITQTDAEAMLQKMQAAVHRKDVKTIMDAISLEPGTRVANLNADQLRLMLARAFRNSGELTADVSNIKFTGGTGQATLEFDLAVNQRNGEMTAADYRGRITLRLKRVEVPRLLGIVHAQEWRIVGAETTGPDPANFGDY